jgi:type II secretory pathway pseudopilin PulG
MPENRSDRGYAMAALLVGMAVMAIMLGVALPVWRTAVQREREAELVFRGEQYANAIAIFQRRTGGFPLTLDQLEKTRAIRKLYKDPITGGDFQPVFVGQMIGGAPVVPGQQGRGARGQPARGGVAAAPVTGRGQTPAARGAAPSPFTGGGVGQTGFGTGQTGTPAAGPIIGVVSRSTADSLRLYNGRGKYNEWAFVSTAATQQAGAPTGAQTPGVPGGPAGPPGQRGAQPGPRGAQPGARPGGTPRGLPFPGRGIQPPGRGFPGTPRGVQGFPPPGAPQP